MMSRIYFLALQLKPCGNRIGGLTSSFMTIFSFFLVQIARIIVHLSLRLYKLLIEAEMNRRGKDYIPCQSFYEFMAVSAVTIHPWDSFCKHDFSTAPFLTWLCPTPYSDTKEAAPMMLNAIKSKCLNMLLQKVIKSSLNCLIGKQVDNKPGWAIGKCDLWFRDVIRCEILWSCC